MPLIRSGSFTQKYQTLQGVLFTPLSIDDPTTHRYKGLPQKSGYVINAIWDTGATSSAITPKVAADLKLSPIGQATVHTANGSTQTNVYVVDILLPNNIWVSDVKVTEAPIVGADALIGMDIILLGDFAVTNQNNRTTFSFIIPSIKEIDFVQKTKPKQNTYNPPVKGKGRR
ncbi:retropepsin-like aspartic protease [Paracholeplasma manati]|uniref:retropepsin-like aspartic protease n=1 Tax=Paracholeplasma manati TaxID=591373 RepID=UPI00240807D2|nr:retropepsin-like aspartic protease [Paracholeplasma manati]MDG0887849.1 retropepsin-like aspartic protease [Paracholeplasma manati]